MVTTSAAYKTAIRGIGRQIWSRVVFPAIPFTASSQIINIEIESNLTGSDDFEIGTAYMSTAKVVLQDDEWAGSYIPSNLTGTECTIQVGINVSPGVEYISLGRFIVEKQTYNSGEVTLSLVDFMSKADVPFTAQLVYPVTILQILQAAASQVGLPLETTSFANSSYTVQNEIVFEGVTCRRVFAQVAELAGGYAVINRSGNLEILTLGKGSTSLDANEHVHELKKFEIGTALFDKVIVKVGEEAASAGTGTNIYTVVDNMFVQNPSLVVNGIYGVLSGYTYTPIDLLDWIGDGSIELGDRVTISGDNTYLLRRKLNLSGGLSEVYRAPIKSNVERNSTGKTNTNLELNKLKTQVKIISGEIDQVISDTEGNFTQIHQDIDSISDRVETAEGDINSLELTADSLTNRISDAEGNVSTLQNTATGLTNRVSNAEGNVSTLQNTATSLQSQITASNGDISTLNQTASSLTSRIGAAEGNISTLNQTAQGLALDIAAADGRALNAQATADAVTLNFKTSGERNLLKNGNAEAGNSDLTLYAYTGYDYNIGIREDEWVEFKRTHEIRNSGNPGDYTEAFNTVHDLIPGKTYTVTMRLAGHNAENRFYMVNQAGDTIVGGYSEIADNKHGGAHYGNWAIIKHTFVASDQIMMIRLRCTNKITGVAYLWAKEMRINEGTESMVYMPFSNAVYGLSHVMDASGYAMKDSNGIEIMSLSKGVANEQNIGRVDNVESGYPMKLPFHIGSEISQITQAVLKWDIAKFRTYSKGAASGGGAKTTPSGGGSTSGPSSKTTADNSGPATFVSNTQTELSYPNEGKHYHRITAEQMTHSHGMAHTHTTPSHTHSLDITHEHAPVFGVLEQNLVDYAVMVVIDGVHRVTTTAQRGEIDLSTWITTSGWHTIELHANNLMRIDANLFLKTYIRR